MSDEQNKESEKLLVKDDEKAILMHHSYDGIKELNHPLPNWWNGIFIISVIFSMGYFVYYQFMGGPTLKEEFHSEFARVEGMRAEFKRQNSVFNSAYYEEIVKHNGVEKGKAVYELNCMPCHMEGGRGDVGPNLTDDYWILAKGTPATIHTVVFNGSEENGMPAWGELIKKDEIYQAIAYVMTFHNTFVKGGKAPQGDHVADEK